MTADTIFQSGSLGKMFTSAALMLQVEDGKIALSDPIATFFPGAPSFWQGITVRHLLTHTSGIPDHTDGAIDLRKDYTEEQLAEMAYGLKPGFAPGEKWSYSNTGYLLLGIIIHKASGAFYGDVLTQRVFRPLGMTTARVISEADIVPHRSAGYTIVDGELKNQSWVSPSLNTTGDGALFVGEGPRRLAGIQDALRALRSRRSLDRVLANLTQANPAKIVDGIAALIEPALAPPR